LEDRLRVGKQNVGRDRFQLIAPASLSLIEEHLAGRGPGARLNLDGREDCQFTHSASLLSDHGDGAESGRGPLELTRLRVAGV
jgi:hypothetical protein